MLVLDEEMGEPQYPAFIKNEIVRDYQAAVCSIEEREYRIKGLTIDGKQTLFSVFSNYKIQMCQYHMKQIIRRYFTAHPEFKAAIALKEL